jgi:uncharacterized protein (TIGR02246 family)
MKPEEEIRMVVERRVAAVRARDVEGAVASTAPDVEAYDVVNRLRSTGVAVARARATEWFASFEGPIGYEIRDLRITAGEDVAFSYGLNHVSATTKDGTKLDMWWRGTNCYRRIDGRWMCTHEHNSVPFDVANGKASLDLKP